MPMCNARRKVLVTLVLLFLIPPITLYAQNQVLGEVQFEGKDKADKNSGVWIDGQYVGYVEELRGDKKVLLLPGEHEISIRQTGYVDLKQKVMIEPGKTILLHVAMQRDPQAQYSAVTAEIKLRVTPDRAAVFLDDNFAGTVREFSGVGRAMLVSPEKHHVRIALPGYQAFETEVNLRPRQKITIKTNLVAGSIAQADPSIKKD